MPKDGESRALLLALWSSILASYSDAEIESAACAAFAAAHYPITPADVVSRIAAARFAATLDANIEADTATGNAIDFQRSTRRLLEGRS